MRGPDHSYRGLDKPELHLDRGCSRIRSCADTLPLTGVTGHTSEHTSRKVGGLSGAPEMAVGDTFLRFLAAPHSVWGCVVPDIPDFCRELVAALAEE
jgi:hypothetical protein